MRWGSFLAILISAPLFCSSPTLTFLQEQFDLAIARDRSDLSEVTLKVRATRFEKVMKMAKERWLPRYGEELAHRILAEDYSLSPAAYEGRELASIQYWEQKREVWERKWAQELCTCFRGRFLECLIYLTDAPLIDEFLQIDRQALAITSASAQRQIYFELFKCLSYHQQLLGFNNTSYLKKQIALFQLSLKTLGYCEKRPAALFPHFPGRPWAHFVFSKEADPWLASAMTWGENETKPPFPFAVYKQNGEWAREIAAWELACLFGCDAAFLPTTAIDVFEGPKASLQPYWHYLFLWWPHNSANSFTGLQDYYGTLVEKFSLRPYALCCISSLLLSLYDQSYMNCRYRQLKDGSLAILNFDNGALLPSRNGFFPEYVKSDSGETNLNCLPRTYWTWYYDFPQSEHPLSKRDLEYLKTFVSFWPEFLEDFKTYLQHPLNDFPQTGVALCIRAFEERLLLIHETIANATEGFTLKELLFTLYPPYRTLLQNLKERLSVAKEAPMTVLWCVNMKLPELRHWLQNRLHAPVHEIDDFCNWYLEFAASLTQSTTMPALNALLPTELEESCQLFGYEALRCK